MMIKDLPIDRIICGDCLEIMSDWPDNSVDLTVTSPPYDNLRDYEGYTFEFEKIARQLYRITKQGGVVVWVIGDATINGSETGTSFKQALYFKEIGFNLHDTMIYQRQGRFPDKKRYSADFEYMFILSKGELSIANLINDKINIEAGKRVHGRQRRKNGDMEKLSGMKRGAVYNQFGVRSNVWTLKAGFGISTKDAVWEHPAVFPEALARDHIKSWSNLGMIVLDPMCGSGTTCKMAMLLDRHYIGIDISEKYCELARNRIKQAQAQQRMFAGVV